MPLSPGTKGTNLAIGKTAAIGVRFSDGKLVGCNDGPAEVEFELGGGGGSTVPDTRQINSGAGLTGGGDLSADRTLVVGQNADGSVVVNADDIQVAAAIQAGAALGATSVQGSRTITAGAGLTGGGDLSANRTLDVAANADGSITVNANDIQVGVLASDAQHGNRGGGGIHANATTSVAGFMSAADKVKLDAANYGVGAMFFSPVDYMTGQTAFVRNGGNFTTGLGFQLTGSATISGVRFYWVRNATDRTVKCSIFNGSNTNLATVDVNVTSTGYYTGTFGSPLSVSQADATTTTYLKVGVWDKSGNDYTRFSGNPGIVPAFPFVGGTKIIWKNWNAFAAGDASPTGSGTEYYPVEPIFA